jgi:hypothetical protein
MYSPNSRLCCFRDFLLPHVDVFSCHPRPEQNIPMDEKRLREIRLDTNNLPKRNEVSKFSAALAAKSVHKPDDECHDNPRCFRS